MAQSKVRPRSQPLSRDLRRNDLAAQSASAIVDQFSRPRKLSEVDEEESTVKESESTEEFVIRSIQPVRSPSQVACTSALIVAPSCMLTAAAINGCFAAPTSSPQSASPPSSPLDSVQINVVPLKDRSGVRRGSAASGITYTSTSHATTEPTAFAFPTAEFGSTRQAIESYPGAVMPSSPPPPPPTRVRSSSEIRSVLKRKPSMHRKRVSFADVDNGWRTQLEATGLAEGGTHEAI